jgi:hypothetical protein
MAADLLTDLTPFDGCFERESIPGEHREGKLLMAAYGRLNDLMLLMDATRFGAMRFCWTTRLVAGCL